MNETIPRRSRWLASPLLHFLLIGGVLAVAQSLLWPQEPARLEPMIVDAAVVGGLARGWTRSTGRPATEAELDLLVQDWVDQELLVREALAQGIDRDDAVVQRRLIQNQRFVEGAAGATSLSDAELLSRAFALGLERTDLVVRRRLIERMREIILSGSGEDTSPADAAGLPKELPEPLPWIRLTQLAVSRDRHRDNLETEATDLLEQLGGGGLRPDSPEIAGWGDPLLLPRHLPRMSPERLSARFGAGFGPVVAALPLERWSGPVESSYGLHLVWPHERGELPAAVSAANAQMGTDAIAHASMQEALQILRQRVDVIRYDRRAPP